MKLDQANKDRKFTVRVLKDFSEGLFKLLETKPLENITVGELCNVCNYPRSTFYNYFEDIYVLMEYCWQRIYEELEVGNFADIDHTRRTRVLFGMVYDFMDENRKRINKLLKHNPVDGAMVLSLNRFIRTSIREMILLCPAGNKYPVPFPMIAEHYGNTIQMVLTYCITEDRKVTKEEALAQIEFLLGTLEKENTGK